MTEGIHVSFDQFLLGEFGPSNACRKFFVHAGWKEVHRDSGT